MSLARLAVAFLLLLLPHLAAAGPFFQSVYFHSDQEYGWLDLDERQGGVATWSNSYWSGYGPEDPYSGDHLWGGIPDQEFAINGWAEFTSGPFISKRTHVSPYGDNFDTFTSRFAAGGVLTFTLDATPLANVPEWPRIAAGPMQTIEFVGRMGAFDVVYNYGDGGQPYGGGDVLIPITRWEMSREDADFLGLRRRRGVGGLQFYLDTYAPDGVHDLELRTYDTFQATAVPEPALVGLVLVGVGASLRRWQRGRRASGRT